MRIRTLLFFVLLPAAFSGGNAMGVGNSKFLGMRYRPALARHRICALWRLPAAARRLHPPEWRLCEASRPCVWRQRGGAAKDSVPPAAALCPSKTRRSGATPGLLERPRRPTSRPYPTPCLPSRTLARTLAQLWPTLTLLLYISLSLSLPLSLPIVPSPSRRRAASRPPRWASQPPSRSVCRGAPWPRTAAGWEAI